MPRSRARPRPCCCWSVCWSEDVGGNERVGGGGGGTRGGRVEGVWVSRELWREDEMGI
jgi:hypothetical protein